MPGPHFHTQGASSASASPPPRAENLLLETSCPLLFTRQQEHLYNSTPARIHSGTNSAWMAKRDACLRTCWPLTCGSWCGRCFRKKVTSIASLQRAGTHGCTARAERQWTCTPSGRLSYLPPVRACADGVALLASHSLYGLQTCLLHHDSHTPQCTTQRHPSAASATSAWRRCCLPHMGHWPYCACAAWRCNTLSSWLAVSTCVGDWSPPAVIAPPRRDARTSDAHT